jgi:hypothetical protein
MDSDKGSDGERRKFGALNRSTRKDRWTTITTLRRTGNGMKCSAKTETAGEQLRPAVLFEPILSQDGQERW